MCLKKSFLFVLLFLVFHFSYAISVRTCNSVYAVKIRKQTSQFSLVKDKRVSVLDTFVLTLLKITPFSFLIKIKIKN